MGDLLAVLAVGSGEFFALYFAEPYEDLHLPDLPGGAVFVLACFVAVVLVAWAV
jgi:hypothetical protein